MPSLETAQGRCLATEARWLSTFWQRGRGWIGRAAHPQLALGIPLVEGERIHTFGVLFPLELIYCDRSGCVLRVRTLAPQRIASAVPGAVVVWERAAGGAEPVAVGEVLVWH